MRTLTFFAAALLVGIPLANPRQAPHQPYIGFDRNDYPGDDALPTLRKSFSFAGYWLNAPPGEKTNRWAGKRSLIKRHGFGFLLLYPGRASAQMRSAAIAENAGRTDAQKAAAAAAREGFSQGSVIFVDLEEGGRLVEAMHRYLRSWATELSALHFRPAVYCSGIPVDQGGGVTITTADDIRTHMGSLELAYWVYNDACPPSPGCRIPQGLLTPSASGVSYASVWQFVRSPREKDTAARCVGYAPDGNCFAAMDAARRWHLDLDLASSADPSEPK